MPLTKPSVRNYGVSDAKVLSTSVIPVRGGYQLVVFHGSTTLYETSGTFTIAGAHEIGRQWLVEEEWIDG